VSVRRFLAYDPVLDRAGLLVLLLILAVTYPTVALVIASAMSHAAEGAPTAQEFGLFLASTGLLVIAFTLVMLRAVHAVERAAYGSRADLIRGLGALELPEQERIGGDELYFNAVRNVRNVSDATFLLSKMVAVSLGMIGSLVVLAITSFQAAMILLLVFLVLAAFYLPNLAFISRAHDQAQQEEQAFFAGIQDVLYGFKEIKLNRAKGDQLVTQVLDARAEAARQARAKAALRSADNYLLQIIMLIGAAGVFLLIMPAFYPGEQSAAVTAAFFTLFLPAGILLQVPVFMQARSAVERLFTLKDRLQAGTRRIKPAQFDETLHDLALHDVSYRYGSDAGGRTFRVGPVSISVPTGCITFIVGGNGSGKSTLIKVITGLYPTQTGEIRLNGQAVDMARHRTLISAVFTDSFLFDRLYGLTGVDANQLNRLLAALGLETKTRYEHGRFSQLDLSSGQKKRVALAVALLEDKPIWVLDEWAADQDPEFRALFYRAILPALRARGKTVLVVSHDDRYFDVADRIVRMEDGHIVENRWSADRSRNSDDAAAAVAAMTDEYSLAESVLQAINRYEQHRAVPEPDGDTPPDVPNSKKFGEVTAPHRPQEPSNALPRRIALFDLLRQTGQEAFVRLIVWTSLAAAGQIAAVAFLGWYVSAGGAASWGGWQSVLIFAACLGITAVAIHQMLQTGLAIAHDAGTRLSLDLARRVRASELRTIENIGANRIFAAASRDAGTVASGCHAAVNTLLVLGLILSALLVLIIVAPAAALVTTIALAINLAFFRATETDVDRLEAEAEHDEQHFAALTLEAVNGFKDLKMDHRRARDLIERTALPAAQDVLPARVSAATSAVWQFNLLVFIFFGALAGISFVLPQFGFGGQALFAGLVVLYLFQYLGDLVGYQQQLKTAATALSRIRLLEADLMESPKDQGTADSRAGVEVHAAPTTALHLTFSTLSLNGVGFEYRDRAGSLLFRVGPLDLEVRAGDTLLIAGGNGAGKSTLLRVLTGLYPTHTGIISIDGRRVTRSRLRGLFATVFTDFHLFDRLYGVTTVDHDRVARLLDRFALTGKVTLTGDRFSTTAALSTGQRKRLALVAALLEARPVLVFDEWTADQDPEFREIFYTELLPELKAEGRTIIAVTHDDRYFGHGDRLIRMRRGRIDVDGRLDHA